MVLGMARKVGAECPILQADGREGSDSHGSAWSPPAYQPAEIGTLNSVKCFPSAGEKHWRNCASEGGPVR